MSDAPPAPTERAAPTFARRWLLREMKLVLLAAVLWFVGRTLIDQLGEVSRQDIHFRPVYLAGAALCMVVAGLIGVAIRRLLLGGFCEPPGWRAMAAISWVPLVGKYIPGKFFSVAGTIWMLRRCQVREPVAASLVLVVNALSMMVGLMLAIPLTFWGPVTQRIPLAWLWGLLLLAAFALCLHPRIFGAVLNSILRLLKRPPLAMVPRARNYVEPLLLMLCNWVLTGTALWLVTLSIASVSLAQLPIFISTAALAATVGLMAFFAPAGLGVREGMQLLVLNDVIGRGPAALVAMSMRLVQTLVEVLLVAAGLVIRSRMMKQAPSVVSDHAAGPGASA
jgi:hypothetical protein